jgi:hypothetical protein
VFGGPAAARKASLLWLGAISGVIDEEPTDHVAEARERFVAAEDKKAATCFEREAEGVAVFAGLRRAAIGFGVVNGAQGHRIASGCFNIALCCMLYIWN